MSENMDTPIAPSPVEKKKTSPWLIVGIVAIVLCCACIVIGALAWQFGDQLMHALGVY